MIRLTGIGTHETIYISPESITSICGYDNGCSQIYSGSDLSVVTEPPAEVAHKVLEWKLAMADYQDSSGEYRQMMRETLEELAGLHGKKLDAFIKRMEELNHDT